MLTKSVEVSAWINSGQILDVMNASIKDYQCIFVVFVTSMHHSKTLNQARYRLGYGLEGHKELRTGGGAGPRVEATILGLYVTYYIASLTRLRNRVITCSSTHSDRPHFSSTHGDVCVSND